MQKCYLHAAYDQTHKQGHRLSGEARSTHTSVLLPASQLSFAV
jgi:hypothetical protein